MQNAGEEEGREESSRQNEEDSSLQEEGDETAEGSRGAAPLDPEEMAAPRSDDPVPWSEPDLDEEEQGENSHMMPPEEEEEEEEEEELTILDMDHPLVRTYQDAVAAKCRRYLERLNLELDEKRAVLKADDQYLLEANTGLYKIQKKLTTVKNKLEDSHRSLAEAKTKHLEAKDQQEETKRRYSITEGQHSQIKAEVSKLQTELDKAMQHLVFTQDVSEDLHSKVKTMNSVRRKVGAEKTQAEEQKLKKDLYIKRLTKDVEKLAEQKAMYEVQATAQREEKCAVKEALYEREMVMETLLMSHKHLLQQWNKSLMAIKRQDETYSAMQEALRSVKQQVILLDRESEDYKKSIFGLQEENEALTMQLNRCETEFTSHEKLLSQKQAEQEALLAHYHSCSRTLQETEKTVVMCTKDVGTYQTKVNNQRKELQKESSLSLQLQGEIMTQMQQKLAHSKAAQDSQHHIAKMSTLKRAKICHLEQLENDLSSVRLETLQVDQYVGFLALTQGALNEELAKCEELLTMSETQMSSLFQIIKQKGQTITIYNRKLSEVKAKTGHEDLSLLQFKAEERMTQIQELVAQIKKDQQLWLKQQEVLVTLTQQTEAKRKEMSKLQTQYISIQQRKIHLDSQIELEEREEAKQENAIAMLNRDLVKLSSLVSEKKQLSQILEQDNALMKSEFLQRFKDAECESVKMQMDLEKVQEENERLLNALVESKQQIVLWEKKTEILKETFSTVDSGKDEIKKMKDEIHRMEKRIEQLKKQQASLKRESEAAAETWGNIMLRKEAKARTAHKGDVKATLELSTQGLQRKIQETCRHVKECEQVYRELQKTQDTLRHQLVQEKKQLIELSNTSDALDLELVNLQDTKETDFAHLLTLQNRSKKLRAVCEGSYKASSSSETVAAAIQSQIEHLQAVRTILHQVCEDVPEHQGTLRKVLRALTAHTQVL